MVSCAMSITAPSAAGLSASTHTMAFKPSNIMSSLDVNIKPSFRNLISEIYPDRWIAGLSDRVTPLDNHSANTGVLMNRSLNAAAH